jgi:hypothetical protein
MKVKNGKWCNISCYNNISYRYWYNYIHLKHSGLNYKTPIEKLKSITKKSLRFNKKNNMS